MRGERNQTEAFYGQHQQASEWSQQLNCTLSSIESDIIYNSVQEILEDT